MEGLTSIQIVLLGLGGIGILVVIIFLIRVNDKGYDYDRIIRELNEQQEKDLEELNAGNGNKEIDKIESEILKCKKKLGMKLFDK